MKNDVNVASKSNQQRNVEKKNEFLVAILEVPDENSRIRSRISGFESGSVSQSHGYPDPDPY
jgi:hypothetical protein